MDEYNPEIARMEAESEEARREQERDRQRTDERYEAEQNKPEAESGRDLISELTQENIQLRAKIEELKQQLTAFSALSTPGSEDDGDGIPAQ